MKFKNLVLGALVGAGTLVASLGSASAYIVCNREGDCWHSEHRDRYRGVQFDYHPDDYYFHQRWDDHHHWREHHEGRGYYRSGIWVTL